MRSVISIKRLFINCLCFDESNTGDLNKEIQEEVDDFLDNLYTNNGEFIEIKHSVGKSDYIPIAIVTIAYTSEKKLHDTGSKSKE